MSIVAAWSLAGSASAIAVVLLSALRRTRLELRRERELWERRFELAPANLLRVNARLEVQAASARCRDRSRERAPGLGDDPADWRGRGPADLGFDDAPLRALLHGDAGVVSAGFDLDAGRVQVRAARVSDDEHVVAWDWAPSPLEDQQACVGHLLEEFPMPVLLADESGRVTLANRAARSALASATGTTRSGAAGDDASLEHVFGRELQPPPFATVHTLRLGGRRLRVTCQPLRGRDGVRRGQLLVWKPQPARKATRKTRRRETGRAPIPGGARMPERAPGRPNARAPETGSAELECSDAARPEPAAAAEPRSEQGAEA